MRAEWTNSTGDQTARTIIADVNDTRSLNMLLRSGLIRELGISDRDAEDLDALRRIQAMPVDLNAEPCLSSRPVEPEGFRPHFYRITMGGNGGGGGYSLREALVNFDSSFRPATTKT